MGERVRRSLLTTRDAVPAALLAAAILAASATFGQPAALAAIRVYQAAGAPVMARVGIVCPLTPSCSHFAAIVIARDGVVAGGWQALRRAGACGWVR